MVRIPLAADDSFAAIRARSRFGIAIAAMIKMIATTINSSISENPLCLRICFMSPSNRYLKANRNALESVPRFLSWLCLLGNYPNRQHAEVLVLRKHAVGISRFKL